MLYLSAWSCAVRTLLYQTTSGHRGQRWGRLAWAPLPAILHFDLPVRQLLNTEIKTKMKTIILNNYYPHLTERVILEASDEITVTLSLVAACVTATKRHKQDHGERSMGTDHGFEADMPYPPLSPEQPLETGEESGPPPCSHRPTPACPGPARSCLLHSQRQ